MASFITFNPPLDKSGSAIEIRDFFLGSSGGKGADGRGYPAHMRRLWVKDVREAIVLMTPVMTSDQQRTEYERNSPQYAQIRAAVDRGTVFGTVMVTQSNRRVTMYSVKIARCTLYINEPVHLMLSFQRMTEVSR